MQRCPRGSVRIGKRLAFLVLDWHGGMSHPSYAVGSSGYAGHCVSKALVRQAIAEFRAVLASPSKLTARVQLQRLVASLEKKAGG
jgi:hypothetical protein